MSQRPIFAVLIRTVNLLAVLIPLFAAGCFAPTGATPPALVVQYHTPALSPDQQHFFFIKTVSQQVHHGGMYNVDLAIYPTSEGYAAWSRSYLCSVDLDGKHRRVIMEVPTYMHA